MNVKTDVVNLQVNVKGNQAQKDLGDLRKKAADIRFEMQGLKKGTQDYITKANELKQVTAKMDDLKKSIGLTGLNLKELVKEQQNLNRLKSAATPFSEEYKQYNKQLEAVSKRIFEVKNGVQGFSAVFAKISAEVKQFGVLAAGYLGFQFITSQFQNILRSGGRLSDQLADLRRVSGLTAEEVRSLNKSLTDLDTRTSTEALRNIAIVAGKLGVEGKQGILDFTIAVDKLVVALGDELGSAEQITDSLGKILNVFDGKITGDNITKLGNAFVELANTGAASGAFIADFDQRLSGIAKSSGISLGALSGLGAGLEEMGAKVEATSTGIQKLIIGIAADIPKAARIAGESVGDFTKLFKLDPTEALLRYSEGLVKNKQNFAEVVTSLKDAGEEGSRTIETLTKLGEGATQLRGRILLGKEAIGETSAITEAFRLKNETLGAQLDKLGKEFNRLISSQAVTSFLAGAVANTLKFIEALKQLPKFINDNSTAIKLLIFGLATLNSQYLAGFVAIVKDTAAKIANAIATRGTALATNIAISAQAYYIVITNLLTGRITLATAAQRLWNIATYAGAGPIGAIAIAAGALLLVIGKMITEFKSFNALQAVQAELSKRIADSTTDQVNKTKILTDVLKDQNTSLDNKKKALQELINLDPEYLKGLTLANINTAEGKKILDGYVESLREKARIEAITSLRSEKVKRSTQLQLDISKISPSAAANGTLPQQALTFLGVGEGGKLKESLKEFTDLNAEIKILDAEIASVAKKDIKKIFNDTGEVVDKNNKALGFTVNDLKNKITALDEQIGAAQVGSKKLADLLAERKKLQTQLDSITGEGKGAKQLSFREQLKKSINDRIDSFKGSGKLIPLKPVDIELPINIKAQNLTPKEIQQEIEEMLTSVREETLKNLSSKRLTAQLKAETSTGKKKRDAVVDDMQLQQAEELAQANLTEEQIALIKKKWANATAEYLKQEAIKQIQEYISYAQQALNVLDSFSQIAANKENAELSRDRKVNDEKKNNLAKQLKAKAISQAAYNREIEKLDEAYNQKKKAAELKQFKRQQKISILQANINGAMAVTNAFATVQPFWAAIIAAAFATAATIAQIATIKSQTPPEAAKGMVVNGPRHSQGGIDLVERRSGRAIANMEGGEPIMILSRETRRNNGPIIDALLENSMFRNGASIAPQFEQPRLNVSKLVPLMQSGGMISPAALTNFAGNGQQNAEESNRLLQALVIEQAAMRNDINSWNTRLKADVSLREINEKVNLLDAARSASGLN